MQAMDLALLSQGSTVVLLALLFVLLRRQAVRRPYFHAWAWAWIALAVALAVVVLRLEIFPSFLAVVGKAGWWLLLSAFLYQFGKLAFLLLLLQGVLLYLSSGKRLVLMRRLWVVVFLVALLSAIFAKSEQALMFWQGLFNFSVYLFAAAALLLLPGPRQSLGTRVMGLVLAATAVLWAACLLALAPDVIPGLGRNAGLEALLQGPNNYLDLIGNMLLAFGMVLVLFEDTRREIDTAHQELRVAHQRLLREAYLDALTGAYNRRALAEGIGMEYAKAGAGAMVSLDMDNLKEVNDRYGHKCGDALLRRFVTVLRLGLRPTDKLYRVGGDEFLIVMPGALGYAAGQRIADILAAAPALKLEDTGVLLGLHASVGTADFTSARDIQAAIHAADRAMYVHKHPERRGSREGGVERDLAGDG